MNVFKLVSLKYKKLLTYDEVLPNPNQRNKEHRILYCNVTSVWSPLKSGCLMGGCLSFDTNTSSFHIFASCFKAVILSSNANSFSVEATVGPFGSPVGLPALKNKFSSYRNVQVVTCYRVNYRRSVYKFTKIPCHDFEYNVSTLT